MLAYSTVLSLPIVYIPAIPKIKAHEFNSNLKIVQDYWDLLTNFLLPQAEVQAHFGLQDVEISA